MLAAGTFFPVPLSVLVQDSYDVGFAFLSSEFDLSREVLVSIESLSDHY